MPTLHFFLRFRSTYGQQFYLSGPSSYLGAGDSSRALPLQYLNEDCWYAALKVPRKGLPLRYKYLLRQADGTLEAEWQCDRQIEQADAKGAHVQVADYWNAPGAVENTFYTQPFRETLLRRPAPDLKPSDQARPTHVFRAKAPLLAPHETLCLLGNLPELGGWQTAQARWMTERGEWFELRLDLSNSPLPATYKYGVVDTRSGKFLRFEDGEDRNLDGLGLSPLTVLHDGFARLPVAPFRAAGVAIPVFSLRSEGSFGVGEFTDIRLLADWGQQTGLKLLQLLPVNDTSSTHSWVDSYPYAPISVFALHPLYLNLDDLAAWGETSLPGTYAQQRRVLNGLETVDYERVMEEKWKLIRALFPDLRSRWLKDPFYRDFLEKNKTWLLPYAAFCYFRDRHGTPDFSQWGAEAVFDPVGVAALFEEEREAAEEVEVHLFVQFHLHRQLRAAVDYAHEKGLVLKGDLPIGIYRYSCDAWVAPELYNMDAQAGAPPDDFAVKGQNWGFPTYDWERMKQDDFAWWKRRFAQMSEYFDAFRIDHILGFFRIWSIPRHAVEGIMGRFVPCLPVHASEFSARALPVDFDRYTQPYITPEVLSELFAGEADRVVETFLEPAGEGHFQLREPFRTQRQVADWLEANPEFEAFRTGLYDLISNVLLFRDETEPEQLFHFRISMMDTASYRYLAPGLQASLYDLYVDYFYRRQDEFWRREAMEKLPALKSATRMLICGEDLGMVPHCVPGVMADLGLLSLEIQRMPKDPSREFFHPKDAPYMSVVTPSTHDMSTIRGWWEEDPAVTQRFYNQEMELEGSAPLHCHPWINHAIVKQHFQSPAMWSIFQLQDLLGINENIRLDDFSRERINVPANPRHYWRYRMHLTLEDLIRRQGFNEMVSGMVRESRRG